MLKPQIIDISYARISTANTSQLSSLGNQFKKLKNINRGEIITHVGSGDDEFCDELKNKILAIHNNKNDVRINIIAFDRLTRNFRDLDFLKRYVRYIYVLDEDITFDLKLEIEQVALRVSKCVQELDIIRNRFNRNRESRKRKREEDEENKELKIVSTRKRCLSVSNNMALIGISDAKIKDLEKFIRISQNLTNSKEWNNMFSLMKNLGFSKEEIKKTKEYYDEYIHDNSSYYILKKDLIEFVTKIINNDSTNNPNNHIFINHFINSNIKLGKYALNKN
jgi:hypothetical protein